MAVKGWLWIGRLWTDAHAGLGPVSTFTWLTLGPMVLQLAPLAPLAPLALLAPLRAWEMREPAPESARLLVDRAREDCSCQTSSCCRWRP